MVVSLPTCQRIAYAIPSGIREETMRRVASIRISYCMLPHIVSCAHVPVKGSVSL